MDVATFIWSVAAGLVTSVIWMLVPSVARALVRFRASILMPGADADRMREEWTAALWELKSRRRQIRFAVRLFKDFQKLQTEVEFRATEQTDVESLVEQQVDERTRELRNRLAEQAELQRELEELRLQLKLGFSRQFDDLTLEEIEASLIKKAMERYGNVSLAAKALGLSRSALYRRLERYRPHSTPVFPPATDSDKIGKLPE